MRVQTCLFQPDRHGDAQAFFAALPGTPHVVLAFGAYDLAAGDAPVLAALQRRFAGALMLGCSTAGEIHRGEVSDGSLSVAAITLEHSHARRASAPVSGPDDSYAAGRDVARQLSDAALSCVLLVCDGLKVNNSALVAGLRDHLSAGAVLAGGFAADPGRFADTWVLHDGAARSGFVTAVGFYGERITMNNGCSSGMDVFSGERVVTKSMGNTVMEIDGQPALAVYKEYLGPYAAELPTSGLLFPFSVRTDAQAEKSLVRTVIAVDEAAQSMTVAGDMPNGALVRLMRADFDRVVQAASVAARAARPAAGQQGESLTLAVSCLGRRFVLGDRADDEAEAALAALPAGAHQIGFYSYGEIGPHISAACDLHNQTMTVATLSERA